jgi:hypothetical protein
VNHIMKGLNKMIKLLNTIAVIMAIGLTTAGATQMQDNVAPEQKEQPQNEAKTMPYPVVCTPVSVAKEALSNKGLIMRFAAETKFGRVVLFTVPGGKGFVQMLFPRMSDGKLAPDVVCQMIIGEGYAATEKPFDAVITPKKDK